MRWLVLLGMVACGGSVDVPMQDAGDGSAADGGDAQSSDAAPESGPCVAEYHDGGDGCSWFSSCSGRCIEDGGTP